MKRPLTIEMLQDLKVVPPDDGDETTQLYRKALAGDTTLSAADYLTVRDLTRLAGCRDAALHALLLCMFIAVNEGSVCLAFSGEAIRKKLSLFLDEDASRTLAARIIASDPVRAYPELVADGADGYMPVVSMKTADGTFLYFHKYSRYEEELKILFRELLAGKPGDERPTAATVKAVLREVLEVKPLKIGGKPMVQNDEQRLAVILSLLKDFLIISGGPGTGKTSIVITILRCLARGGVPSDAIRVAAPTGRAARRLKDAIESSLSSLGRSAAKADKNLSDIEESTIHRLLRYDPVRNAFRYNADNRLAADVVIVDEVSMIDIALMARLFEALKPGAKVILLGDKDQLPSVEAGAVLATLMPDEGYAAYSEEQRAVIAAIAPGLKGLRVTTPRAKTLLTDRLVILKESYRSGAGILAVAGKVNEQDQGVAGALPELVVKKKAGHRMVEWPDRQSPGVSFIDNSPGSYATWYGILDAWISRRYVSLPVSAGGCACADTYSDLIRKAADLDLDGRAVDDNGGVLSGIFRSLEEGRILTFLRNGPYGAFGINRHIARRLRLITDRFSWGQPFAGAAIMVVENDPAHELYNGDVGVLVKAPSGSYRAIFERRGLYLSVPLEELPAWTLAFAMTVHKSQGSEYDNVLIVLPQDEKNRLLSKEIVYTALTRARHSAVICGSRAVLATAIGRKIERQSGMRLWE